MQLQSTVQAFSEKIIYFYLLLFICNSLAYFESTINVYVKMVEIDGVKFVKVTD
jgi:hypothetical protein